MRRNQRYRIRKGHGRKRFRRRARKGPTHRSMGVGRGVMGDKPLELVIHRGLGFPARLRTKLRYTETISIASSVGSIGAYVFNANSVYDPNDSGTGHQPMYYDQYTAVYNHWKVLGAKIQVQVIQGTGTSVNGPCAVGVISNDDNSIAGVSQYSQLVEWGQINKYRIINGPYGLTGPVILTEKYSCKRVFKDKYNADSLIGGIATNPTELYTFIIWQQPLATSDSQTNTYSVTIDYIVDFFELRDMAQS